MMGERRRYHHGQEQDARGGCNELFHSFLLR
jgi:hypothetical protein